MSRKVIITRRITGRIMASLLGVLALVGVAFPAQALTHQQFVVINGKPQFVGIIDTLGVTPAADFSVARCLTKNWLGKAIVNIRRASDNATKDLVCLASGQSVGNLDSATFNAFCAATTCFATKVYDQSGNGRDASQGTAANQPQLLLNQTNGRPGLVFTGDVGKTNLATASFASSTSPQSASAVAKRTGNTTEFTVLIGAGGNQNIFGYQNAANSAEILGGTSGRYSISYR